MKKILPIMFIFSILIISDIFSNESDFGNYDIYSKSDSTNTKWDKLIKNAYQMIKNKKYEKAIVFFDKAFLEGCNNDQINKDLILCYFEISDKFYTQGKMSEKEYKKINAERGDKYFKNKLYELAVIFYENAGEKDIKDRSLLLKQKNDFQENFERLKIKNIQEDIGKIKFRNGEINIKYEVYKHYDSVDGKSLDGTTEELILSIYPDITASVSKQTITEDGKWGYVTKDYIQVFRSQINKYYDLYDIAKKENKYLKKNIGSIDTIMYKKREYGDNTVSIDFITLQDGKYGFVLNCPKTYFGTSDKVYRVDKPPVYVFKGIKYVFGRKKIDALREMISEKNIYKILIESINKQLNN